MEQAFFYLSFERYPAILLALIPALLNVAIFFYVVFKLPLNRITKVFSGFLLALFCWQMVDVATRAAKYEATASLWESFLSLGWMMMAPLGLHFALLYNGRRKFATSVFGFTVLYFPAFVLSALFMLSQSETVFSFDPFWGWIAQIEKSPLGLAIIFWIITLLLLSFYFFAETVYNSNSRKFYRKQGLIITVGFSIPLIVGVITEVLFPIVFNWQALPLSSSMMIFFSIATVIALDKYKLFSVGEYIETESIVEKVPNIIVTISTDKVVTFINSYAVEIFQVLEHKLGPFLVDELFKDDVIAWKEFYNNLFLPAANGEEIDNYLLHVKPLNDEGLDLLVSVKPIISNRKIYTILLVARDVTEKYKSEQQLQEKNIQLQKANLELDKFVYSTSHDIRGPLMSLLGLVNLLEEEQEETVKGRYYNLMRLSIDRLDNVTREINEYSKNSRVAIKNERVDFSELLGNVIKEIKFLRETAKVQIRLNLEDEEPFFSDIDRVKLVLRNVVINAIKYADNRKKQPWVKITIKTSAREAILLIEDNGEGIQPLNRDKIFNMFTRFSSTSQGAGLGLYIVKEVVQKLQGTIDVTSDPDKGSVFKILLPNKYLTINDEQMRDVIKA